MKKYIALLPVIILAALTGCKVQEEVVSGPSSGVMGTPYNDPYYNPNQSTGGGGSQMPSGGESILGTPEDDPYYSPTQSTGGGGSQVGGMQPMRPRGGGEGGGGSQAGGGSTGGGGSQSGGEGGGGSQMVRPEIGTVE